jgi:hypothetical protein
MARLAPYSDLWPVAIQTRGQGFLLSAVLSHRVGLGGGALLGDTKPLALDACGGVDCLDTYIIDFYTERMTFYMGMLTLCWNYYGAYACIPGQVTITDNDAMGPCTRVYAVRRVWAPVATPYLHQVMSASVP